MKLISQVQDVSRQNASSNSQRLQCIDLTDKQIDTGPNSSQDAQNTSQSVTSKLRACNHSGNEPINFFFGTGTMIESLKVWGSLAKLSDQLKMPARISVS